MSKLLIAYASKHGATAEIAQKIGDVLRDAGLDGEVLPVERVGNVAAFDAVILGSAVYAGQWRREAVQFVKQNVQKLSERPFFIFSSGPTGEGDPHDLVNGWQVPKSVEEQLNAIQPRDIVVFHGALDPEELNFFERFIIKRVKAPTGDFRDWEMIVGWAQEVASQLNLKKATA